MPNLNTEYEKLAQEIYQALADSEANNVQVRHNVLLAGRSGCEHQIDVYWEFNSLGETHKVAIECKNFKDNVSIGRVRDFHAALNDIGNIKGIVLTKKAFQSGAIKYADYYGISLKECRFPTDKDWEGRVKDIVLAIHAFFPEVTDIQPFLDIEWLEANTSYKEGDVFQLAGIDSEFKVISESGEEISSFHELTSRLPQDWQEEQNRTHSYGFENAFLKIPSGEKYKLKGVIFNYNIVSSTSESTIEGAEIAKAILKDVQSGRIGFYNQDGSFRYTRDV